MNPFANRIPRGTDTPLIMNVEFDGEYAADGLLNFTRLVVKVGGAVFSTDNQDRVFVASKTQLRAKLGTDENLPADGDHPITVTGYTAVEYDDGYEFPQFGHVTIYTPA